ncbi:DNA repair protein RecO [Neorickettsia helminthoeca str. Oregon]|uniref:DNA repair protein RecO n=1 Tax=Neorickettsia helminthoeca str. Oregon TaxID=1286528 RepID=X5GWD7_9RICK|nr:DNA repair protein RecO [Neorickettsia helminthoeca]AHX11377.1 DNA repair protein RecO [Neorickettsia helminthoeca str. Oregon]
MHWESEGVVLANKGLMENKIVATLFTKHYGLKRGLYSRKAMLDMGNIVYCRWSARLESQLGYFKIESKEIISSFLFTDYRKLKLLNAVISVLLKVLPENEVKEETYHVFTELLHVLKSVNLCYYRKFIEMDLSILQHLGFQLDLSRCAVSGETENLFYISPKTGRAVTKAVGDPYKDKLLLLPQLLYKISNNFTFEEPISREEFIECVTVTGFFLRTFLFFSLNLDLPYYRKSMLDNF